MNRDEIVVKLRSLMKSSSKAEVDWNGVGLDAAIETLGFDSLTILDLIYDIQQGFGVDFEAEALVNVKTVGELADFLVEQTRG